MNTREYLFTCLAEESSEVAQATSKGLRFGFDSFMPKSNFTTNGQHLVQEIAELIAVAELLEEDGYLNLASLYDESIINAKKEKVLKYLQISKNLGLVVE